MGSGHPAIGARVPWFPIVLVSDVSRGLRVPYFLRWVRRILGATLSCMDGAMQSSHDTVVEYSGSGWFYSYPGIGGRDLGWGYPGFPLYVRQCLKRSARLSDLG